jgi:hypothetical protein
VTEWPGTNLSQLDVDTDPRPLYFVPFDPDTHQSEAEKVCGRRVLFERMHGAMIAAVGCARPPTVVTLKSTDLIDVLTQSWERHIV